MRKILLMMAAAFVFAQLLALVAGSQFIAHPDQYQQFDDPGNAAHSLEFFAYVLVSALVLLLVLKYYQGNLFFLAVELLLLFFSLWLLLELVLPSEYALGITLLLVAARLKFAQVREPLLLVATAVVGALIGTWLDIIPAAVFAVLLSGYDLVAVFYTKHMVALAKGLDSRGASFSIAFSTGDPGRVRAAKSKLDVAPIRKSAKSLAKAARERDESVEFIELGTGDIVIPAMLSVAAFKISLYAGVASFIGSLIGLALLFYLLEKRRGYWPALPPIVGCTIGAIVVYLLAAPLHLFG